MNAKERYHKYKELYLLLKGESTKKVDNIKAMNVDDEPAKPVEKSIENDATKK